MKKFLRNITIELSIILIIVMSALLLGPIRVSHSESAWHISAEKHILFCGASQVQCGINDTLMESALNIANTSERYMFTYIKLKQLLKYNPQIDTIFMQFAPTDMWENTDDKYFRQNEQIKYMPLYWSLMKCAELEMIKSDFIPIMKIIVPRLREKYNWSTHTYQAMQGGFLRRDKCIDTINDIPYRVSSEEKHGNYINYTYCRKIINLCNDYNVKLYFMYFPMWMPHLAYDQHYYHMAYKNSFNDVELLDYSNYNVDVCERYDAHHLNYEGAISFTRMVLAKYHIK